MFRLIFGLLLVAIGIVLVVVKNYSRTKTVETRNSYGAVIASEDKTIIIKPVWKYGIPFLVIGLLFVIWSTIRTVPPRSVGVQVTLGKVESTLDSGPHMVKPWSTVKKFPSTIQTTILNGNGTAAQEDGACVTVRLGNQTTACVNVTTQWHVNTGDEKGVESLYSSWRTFDHIEPNLVQPQLRHAVLAPFEAYDPLATLDSSGKVQVPTKELEAATRTQLEQAVGSGITITQLTINLVQYDGTTQDKLNGYAQALADTRIAQQREQTSTATARANEALANSSASNNAGVLYQNCIDMTERLVKEGKPLPPAWNCGQSAQTVVPVR